LSNISYAQMVNKMIAVQKFGKTLLRLKIVAEEYHETTILKNFTVKITKITDMNYIKEFIERQRGEY
jgi:hypothetical protein